MIFTSPVIRPIKKSLLMKPATQRSYYPALDGLRGIAIILVLCCHNFNFIPGLRVGWVGVDLFFVLSGFLITDILIRTKDNKNFLQNFYIRRILRIFPLYYGALLLFFIIVPFIGSLQVQYHYYHQNQAFSWLHLQNWLYILREKPGDDLLLNHFWSLSVEEQFYLVWPLIVIATKNNRQLGRIALAILAACIISRFCSWLYLGNGYTNFYFQFMTRVDGLCIGSLIAIWKIENFSFAKKQLVNLAIILLAAHLVCLVFAKTIFLTLPHFSFFGYSSIACVFGFAVFFAVEKRNRISALILESRFLRYFGKISYSLYVFHWPVLVLTKMYALDLIVRAGMTHSIAYILVSIAAFFIAFLLSIASYHFVELKIQSLKEVVTAEGYWSKTRKRLALAFGYRTGKAGN